LLCLCSKPRRYLGGVLVHQVKTWTGPPWTVEQRQRCGVTSFVESLSCMTLPIYLRRLLVVR
jgi:hypothetical protein